MSTTTILEMRSLFGESVTAVQPHHMIRDVVKVNGSNIKVGQQEYDLTSSNCYIIGFGKAVSGMAKDLERALGEHLIRGIISVPIESQKIFKEECKFDLIIDEDFSKIEVFEGAKDNLPDEDSYRAAKEIAKLVQDLKEDDILFVLITGGGSALLPYPISPITLTEKAKLISDLSNAGATIQELNSVRKRLSKLKGGNLALLASPAKVVSLILSDIVGDPLDLISSSPTVKNSDPQDAPQKILHKYHINVPPTVQEVLDRSSYEPVNDSDFLHVQNILVGNIDKALDGFSLACRKRSIECVRGSTTIVGEAREVGRKYAQLAYSICNNNLKEYQNLKDFFSVKPKLSEIKQKMTDRPICLVFGGETIVRVLGNGRGGRNQEMVLSFAKEFDRLCHHNGELRNDFNVHFMSAGTDGIDGPTDAAGAIAHNEFMKDAKKQGLDVDNALRNNDSYTFLKKLNQAANIIIVGHTGTNVMDIQAIRIMLKF